MQLPSILKQAIIRIDFIPIPEFLEYARFERNNPSLQNFFINCREIKTNNIEVDITSDTLPKLKVNDTIPITRFAGPAGGFDQDAIYDIAPTFICLTINCDDKYKSIIPYTKFIIDAFKRLWDYGYFVFPRLDS